MLRKIITADQSESFVNEMVGESYHSQTGAVEEALKKYALPCQIRQRASGGRIRILDVCFGVGYNSAMALQVALEENSECVIEVVGLEYDPQIIAAIQEVNPPIATYALYKRILLSQLELTEGKVSVRVVLGDAREKIKELPENYFDAVFFDPFSPKTSPEMWQRDFLAEVYRVMHEKGTFATYSCARVVRENLSAAGFMYDNGPIVGRRGPGTIATKWEIVKKDFFGKKPTFS